MEVKAAVARTRGSPLVIEGLSLDEPRPDEILVRLIASGVTLSDRDAIDGLLPMCLPFVPGSEAAGIVERVGRAVAHIAPGDAVVTCYAACGHCTNCQAGHARRCVHFDVLNLTGRRPDGSAPFRQDEPVGGFFFGQSSFATHILCRAMDAVRVRATAPLEVLACLGGEILAGAGTIRRGFRLSEGDSLAVSGADAAGLVAVMLAKTLGADPIVVADPDENRRKIATECGATVTVHTDDALADAARGLTGDGVRFALDTTGHGTAEEACRRSVRRGGVCAFKTAEASEQPGSGTQVAVGQPVIIPADGHGSPAALIPELAALYDQGRLPLDLLISFFEFQHVNDALDAYRRGRVVKPILRFSLGSFGDLDRAKTEGAVSETDAPPVSDDVDAKERASADAPLTS